MKRVDPNASVPEAGLVIRLLQVVSVVFARLYHRLTVRSPSRLPQRGAAILVCNHTSGVDPVLIQSVCSRLIVWMMAAEYYDLPVLSWLFRQIRIIPTTRSGRDLSAVRGALRALQQGRVVGLFPEGRIAPPGQLLPFETGVALLAIRAGVPVYPAYLDGSQRGKSMLQSFLTRNVATIRFGPPVEFPRTGTSKADLEAATARIQAAVTALRPVAAKNY